MDDLFQQVNKYAMLKNDIWAASQQILITTLPTQENKLGNSKTLGS